MSLSVQLVSHASIIVTTPDVVLWCDPWLDGTAFNASWRLYPPAVFDSAQFERIDAIWISHEHPDHFHVPTLRGLPADFKQRVKVYIQQNNSDKMRAALERFGFSDVQAIAHREQVTVGQTRLYVYQVGQMDSALGVRSGSRCLLNLNDCEVTRQDCGLMRRDLGAPDVVFNQFSMAGYNGSPDTHEVLSQDAANILENVLDVHRCLGAAYTVPFASFVYFCCVDNSFINEHANSPLDVRDKLAAHGLRTAMMKPGDSLEVGSPWPSERNAAYFEAVKRELASLPLDDPGPRAVAEIREAFQQRVEQLHEAFPRTLLRLLEPVSVWVADLQVALRFDLRTGAFEELPHPAPEDCDLVVRSQPLWFAFKFPFGVQTLGVSGRFRVQHNAKNWRRHRILFSLNNAEVYLRPRHLVQGRTVAWLWQRRRGFSAQVAYQLRRMRGPQ